MRALTVLLVISCQKRSIDKKPPNLNRERERKTKRLRLGFFNINPKHALFLQRGV